MSQGDVLAHYSGEEGLTALLGRMEHTTLESINIESPATHTHHLAFPHCHLTLFSKGQSSRRQGSYFTFSKFEPTFKTLKCFCHCGRMIASVIVSPRMVVIGSNSIVGENFWLGPADITAAAPTSKRRPGRFAPFSDKRKVNTG